MLPDNHECESWFSPLPIKLATINDQSQPFSFSMVYPSLDRNDSTSSDMTEKLPSTPSTPVVPREQLTVSTIISFSPDLSLEKKDNGKPNAFSMKADVETLNLERPLFSLQLASMTATGQSFVFRISSSWISQQWKVDGIHQIHHHKRLRGTSLCRRREMVQHHPPGLHTVHDSRHRHHRGRNSPRRRRGKSQTSPHPPTKADIQNPQNSEVFQDVRALYILVPAILGLKGNLDMCLASRLSTQSNLGKLKSRSEIFKMVSGNISLVQVQAIVAACCVAVFAVSVNAAMEQDFNWNNSLLLITSSVLTATLSCLTLGNAQLERLELFLILFVLQILFWLGWYFWRKGWNWTLIIWLRPWRLVSAMLSLLLCCLRLLVFYIAYTIRTTGSCMRC